MNFCPKKVDLIIQFSLLVAGEEDVYFDRQLGPIHLLKYVYLADLAFATRNNGETFTGIEWKFYNFGPWSQTVHSRIEPALKSILAQCETHESHFGDDDWQRWSKRDKNLLVNKQREIPPVITMTLKRDIHKFLKSTPNLLDYVYSTKPMLSAAPNELLDFSSTMKKKIEVSPVILKFDKISNKKKKVLDNKMDNLRASFLEKKNKRANLVNPVAKPRYDEVYLDAITLLDKAEVEDFQEENKRVLFSNDVWKSSTRKGIENEPS
jgi:hypothetical protein